MNKQTFKLNLNTIIPEEVKKDKNYSLYLPKQEYLFFTDFVANRVKKGELSYNMKKAFLLGLELLENAYPNIPILSEIPRRYYRGGKQKNAGEVYRSTIILPVEKINWINSFIAEQSKIDIAYSHHNFIEEMVNQLKKQ